MPPYLCPQGIILPIMLNRTAQMGTAPIGRLLVRLGTPGMISMFIMTLYNITDTFWVAKLGPGAIAALTIAFPYQMLLVAVGVSSGVGFASLISRCFGEGKIEETNWIAGQIFPLVIGFGLLFCIATAFFTRPLLEFFGVTSDIYAPARDYLFIIGFGVFFTLFSMISNNVLRGSGNTFMPMIFMGLAAILNIILDPFFIFGISIFPAWGVRGAAVATLISQFIAATGSVIYLLSRHSGYRFRWHYLRPNWPVLFKVYQVGLPTFVMQLAASLIMVVINRILSGFGSQAIAANGLIFRLISLLVMPVIGLGQGLLPLVGYNFGARRPGRLWSAVKLASFSSLLIIALGYVWLQLFPAFWIRLFTRDEAFLPLATSAVRMATLLLPLVGPQFIWIITFQALGQGRTAMMISLSRQLIFLLPLLLILPKFMGMMGVWAAIPISDALAFLIGGAFILNEHHQQRRAQAGGPEVRKLGVEQCVPPDWVG